MHLRMLRTTVKNTKIIFLLVLFIVISNIESRSQSFGEIDNTQKKPHSAHKATIYSLILPGLGQAYNKKYWKVPVVYVGFGVIGYMISNNRKEYKLYKAAYEFVPIEGDDQPSPNEYYDLYSKDQLKQGRDYYRRNMELSYIFAGFWYLLNVIDASVDAHLFEFQVSPNLSLRFDPCLYNQPINNQTITGLRMQVSIPGVFGFK